MLSSFYDQNNFAFALQKIKKSRDKRKNLHKARLKPIKKMKKTQSAMKTKMETCTRCKKPYVGDYRFTDWHNDENDVFGTWDDCRKIFDKAKKENPRGRFSIYNCGNCPHCGEEYDEGILFNQDCLEYSHAN